MAIAVQGIGLVGGFGNGIHDFRRALKQGKSPLSKVYIDTASGSLTVPALLADTANITSYISKRLLRRLSHYTRMAFMSACLALEDAGKYNQTIEHEGSNIGLILATGYGATCNAFDFKHSIIGGEPWGSPIKFSNSVHNATAAHISILLKEYGPNLTVSHFDMSMPSAILTACQWLMEDRVESVLVGGVDEFCKVLGYYWDCVQQQDNNPSFHEIIGEGSVFFLLTKNQHSKYGFIREVRMGKRRCFKAVSLDQTLFILNADGYSGCDNDYAAILDTGAATMVYTPVYGGLPIGIGFDLAAAGLIIQSTETELFPASSVQWSQSSYQQKAKNTADTDITCLKFGAAGDYALVRLVQKPVMLSFNGA